MHLGKTQTVRSKTIQMRRRDFRAVAAQVGIAEVIGNNEDDVGLFGGR